MEIVIRNARPEDGAGVAAIYAPYVTDTPITFEEIPPTPQEMTDRIRQTIQQFPYLLAEEAGRVVGYVYAAAHRSRASYRWSVDVAVYLAATHHRRGIGTLLYRHLFGLLKTQGYVMAYAGITLPNSASVALHESFGFKPIGIYRNVGYKLNAWRDVGWWELPLGNLPERNPPEPIPFPRLSESEL